MTPTPGIDHTGGPQCHHCGCEVEDCPHCGKSMARGRSGPDHRRFFAVLNAAFHHWPEHHEFEPDNPEHLRAWLLCKAGYRTIAVVDSEDGTPVGVLKLAISAAEAACKDAGVHAFFRMHGSTIATFRAKSIAWNTMSQSAFHEVRSAVEEIITAEMGMPTDQLLAEMENAA